MPQSSKFKTRLRIPFREGDPAGVLFFGALFSLAHDVFEEFLLAQQVEWTDWFQSPVWACPIRHSEADFLAPLQPGQAYDVIVDVPRLGTTSFQTHYEFVCPAQGHVCAKVTLAHTFMRRADRSKLEIPAHYRVLLENFARTF